MNAAHDLNRLSQSWQKVESLAELKPIKSEAHYDRMVALMHELIEEGAGRDKHPLANLLYILGNLIADYDDAHYPSGATTPHSMLAFFMEQHSLRQADFPELGSQGVVSEILSGKRALNLRQVRALAKRFKVSPLVFIEVAEPKKKH